MTAGAMAGWQGGSIGSSARRRLRALPLLLLGARVGIAAPMTDCFEAFLKTKQQDLARMALSTGTQLPYDAGKYLMCLDIPHARYLLVSMQLSVKLDGRSSAAVPAELGLCVPDACDPSDAGALVGNPLIRSVIPLLSRAEVSNVTATSPQTDLKPIGLRGELASAAVAVLLLLVLCGTALVVIRTQKAARGETQRDAPVVLPAAEGFLQASDQPRQPRRGRRRTAAVEAFSLIGENGTMVKLVDLPPYKPTDCLNGVRVLSMFWIVVGHTFLMPQAIAGYSNMQDVVDTPLKGHSAEDNPLTFLVLSAQSGVDTFFFLGGFLLSMMTLKELRERRGKINVAAALVLRYLRLTPSLVVAMLVYYGILPYLADGPFAPRFQDSVFRRCDKWWWSELTYTVNFVPMDPDAVCMGWTWFLGDDMIFFIMGIAILPLYYRRRLLGWIAVGCIAAASLAACTWLLVRYHLSVYIFDFHYRDYSYYAYSKPYTRAPAYLVGVATSWLLEDLLERGITRESRPTSPRALATAYLAAVAAVGTLLLLVFIPVTDFGPNKNSWGDAVSVLYLNFGRPLWAACWGVLTLLCYFGYLPMTDGFLAHRFWTPLARLTYGAYLLHPLVIKLVAGNVVQYYTFSMQDMVYRTLGNIVGAYCGAVVLWAVIERPMTTLTTAARKGRRAAGSPAAGDKAPAAADPESGTASSRSPQGETAVALAPEPSWNQGLPGRNNSNATGVSMQASAAPA